MCSGDVVLQCTNLCRNGSISIIILYAAVGRCHPSKETLSPRQQIIKLNQLQASPRHCFLRHHASMHQRVSQWQKFHANSVPGIRERPALDIAFRRHHPCNNTCHNGSISILTLHPAFGRCHLISKELLSDKHYVTQLNQFQSSPGPCVRETSSLHQRVPQGKHF